MRSSRTTEERLEDISEAAHVKALKTLSEATSIVTKLVVSGALLRVGKDLVSLVDFLELRFRTSIGILVRMVLESQSTESFLYFILGGIPGDSEYFIIIAFFCHL